MCVWWGGFVHVFDDHTQRERRVSLQTVPRINISLSAVCVFLLRDTTLFDAITDSP